MRQNRMLAMLRKGRPSFGLWLTIGSPILAEEAAAAELEYAILDTQHGYWSHEALVASIQVLSHTNTVPIVRVCGNDPHLIGRMLDHGALGVVVPMVNSRADAEQAVAAVRYPPNGKRSAGGSRLLLYGEDYFPAANPEIFLAVMLETQEAVAHADAILSVPGVDCGFIGPGDLALDLGTFGSSDARHDAAIQAVLAAGQRCGVPVGIACGSVEAAKQRAAQGFQFLDVGSDMGFFWQGIRGAVKMLTNDLVQED